MKKIGTLSLSLVIAASITGCASTSDSSSNQVAVYPELRVMSDKTYIWDDSISEALNVARMAQPAGVGVGMQDFADGTKANTGKVGFGEKAFDSVLGLSAMGAYGALSMGVLNSDVNSLVDWQPSFVLFVPVDELMVGAKYDLAKTRLYVGNILAKSLKDSLKDLKWYGAYYSKVSSANTIFAFETSECKNALMLHYRDTTNVPNAIANNINLFTEPTNFENYCGMYVNLSVSGFYEKNGKRFGIVVGEIFLGQYFSTKFKTMDGYQIFPESFQVDTFDSKGGRSHALPYAFVLKNGKELNFQSK